MLKDNLNEISVISNKDANERALSLSPRLKTLKVISKHLTPMFPRYHRLTPPRGLI